LTEPSCGFWECNRNSAWGRLCNSLPEIGGQIIVYFLHPSPGADEVSGESWQLATAAHGEGDGLTLCEQSS